MGSRLSEPNTQDLVFSHHETAPPERIGNTWMPMTRPVFVPRSDLSNGIDGSTRHDDQFPQK